MLSACLVRWSSHLSRRMQSRQDNTNPLRHRLILASASPRRAALLRQYGYDFEVVKPRVHEPDELAGHPTPEAQAEALSYFKARSVADAVDEGTILAADTVVSFEGRLFGKPANRDDARRILLVLTGTTHQVTTGVTLLDAATAERLIEHSTTAVTMRPMTEKEMEDYLDTRAWEGKAGAYGIQDRGDAFVTRTEGSFTSVVGLPMELVAEMLHQWGYPAVTGSLPESGGLAAGG